MTTMEIITAIEDTKANSAWTRGVRAYAIELMEHVPDDCGFGETLSQTLLNGARTWNQYSWGGASLAYDEDIAHRLCNPSELKRVQYKEGGYRKPNKREEWLDVQSRALWQAEQLIHNTIASMLSA